MGSKVRPIWRRTVLPPDIFKRYEADNFRERPKELPDAVMVV